MAVRRAKPPPAPPPEETSSDILFQEAAPALSEGVTDVETPLATPTVAAPAVPKPESDRLLEFTRAAASNLPPAVNDATAAEETRATREDGGLPVSAVPFTSESALAAALCAASVSKVAAAAVDAPPDADFTAAAVAPAGSASKAARVTVTVVLTAVESTA